MRYGLTLAGVLITLILLDALWLGLIAKSLYQAKIGHLMLDKPNLYAASLFYLIYSAGLIAFVIAPYSAMQSWGTILSYAALYGLCTYATYALTNLAVLKTWPVDLSFIDIGWGMFITVLAACIGKIIFNMLKV